MDYLQGWGMLIFELANWPCSRGLPNAIPVIYKYLNRIFQRIIRLNIIIISGGLMCLIVIGSAHYKCNPDNIATPIAASLGDSVTLAILSVTGNLLFIIPGWAFSLYILLFYEIYMRSNLETFDDMCLS